MVDAIVGRLIGLLKQGRIEYADLEVLKKECSSNATPRRCVFHFSQTRKAQPEPLREPWLAVPSCAPRSAPGRGEARRRRWTNRPDSLTCGISDRRCVSAGQPATATVSSISATWPAWWAGNLRSLRDCLPACVGQAWPGDSQSAHATGSPRDCLCRRRTPARDSVPTPGRKRIEWVHFYLTWTEKETNEEAGT